MGEEEKRERVYVGGGVPDAPAVWVCVNFLLSAKWGNGNGQGNRKMYRIPEIACRSLGTNHLVFSLAVRTDAIRSLRMVPQADSASRYCDSLIRLVWYRSFSQ